MKGAMKDVMEELGEWSKKMLEIVSSLTDEKKMNSGFYKLGIFHKEMDHFIQKMENNEVEEFINDD
jgi:hypothetical protein